MAAKWKSASVDTEILGNLVDPIGSAVVLQAETTYTFLRISYEGRAERGEQALGKEVSYAQIATAQAGDIILSNINAVNRAICVLPAGMEDLLVSNEFTVLRLKPEVEADPQYIWSVLRSSAVIAEWMSGSSGVGRHRVDWGTLQNQVIPLLPYPKQKAIGDSFRAALQLEECIVKHRAEAQSALAVLELEDKSARERLARAKPPK